MDDNTQTKHFWLYILTLEQEKYYIGLTTMSNPYKRIAQHESGYFSAQWTKKYKYLDTIEVRNLGNITQDMADKEENDTTLEYMNKYGYQNVRGGKFNYSGKYRKIGNYFFRDSDWEVITTVVFLMLVIAFLTVRSIR